MAVSHEGRERQRCARRTCPTFRLRDRISAAAIGKQPYRFTFLAGGFRREIAPARTFGFLHELESLKKMDRGRGASLENTLALDGDTAWSTPT